MGRVRQITATSQLKSANTTTDIKFHSGKENRGNIKHENENIDKTRSHLNIEFDMLDKDELLEEHYGEKIRKHNINNKSAARHWDMEKFLATFEGKEVKAFGKTSKNMRWATASQLSYFGGTDSLNPVIAELEQAGASQAEIFDAYASGYRDYIEEHNETFPTMPIYHSDIHFDESTPHGHDAIVVKGHTAKGNPSDSVNMALAEHYNADDYDAYEKAKSFAGRKETMSMYRDENDDIIFRNVGNKLEELAEDYDLDIDFELIRTGDESVPDMKTYIALKQLGEKNDERVKKERDFNRDSRGKQRDLAKREQELNVKEGEMAKLKQYLDLRDDALIERERQIVSKEGRIQKHDNTATAVAMAVLRGDPNRPKAYKQLEDNGALAYDPERLQGLLIASLSEANKGIRRRQTGGELSIQRHVAQMESEQGEPEI